MEYYFPTRTNPARYVQPFNSLMIRVFICAIFLSSCLAKDEKRLHRPNFESEREVILMQNDFFKVSAYQSKIETLYKKNRNKSWNGSDDEKLYVYIINQKTDIIDVGKLDTSFRLNDRIPYLVDDLIEEGDCCIYNKLEKSYELTVHFKEFTSPVGYWGRKFDIKGKLVFSIVDGIE